MTVDKKKTTTTGAKTNDTQALASLLPKGADKYLAAFMASNSSSGSSGGPSTTTSISQYKPQALTSSVNNIWRQELGRDANAKELAMVAKAVNDALKASPTTTYSDGSANPTNVTTTGVDTQAIIQQQALANPETAGYQAATTYYDALLSAIRGPFGGGY